MLLSFPNIVKPLLKRLAANDYPVLNSRLFFEIWLTFVLDSSLTSMRDLFYRLNHSGIEVDMSTLSKACKTRTGETFCRFYVELMAQLKRQHPASAQMLVPLDSTVISLTSKLFWEQEYHQVKLLNGINLEQGNPTECLIHFGQGHDARFAETVNSMMERERRWGDGSRLCQLEVSRRVECNPNALCRAPQKQYENGA
jgi:putative transposase